jgi:hypothetical protein
VSRANHGVTYPARFMLVAAMNPCRCGHAFEPGYACKRGRIDRCTSDYQMRISGPLMDRIDLRIEVPAVTAADLILPPPAEGSAEVASRVAAARQIQAARFAAAGLPQIRNQCRSAGRLAGRDRQAGCAGAKNCFARPPKPCASPRGDIIACCGWPVRWPISIIRRTSAGCISPISPKRCPTARLPRTLGTRRDLMRCSRYLSTCR